MKKVKILLSAVAVVAVVAVAMSANARLSKVIYTHATTDTQNPNSCTVPVIGKEIVAPGTFKATLDPALPCELVRTINVQN